jgi:hypothetical protein
VHAVLRTASLAAGAALLVWGLSGCGGGDADAASASSGTLAHTATLEAPMSAAAAPPVFPLTLYAHANAQRTQRIDTPTPEPHYDRAFSFEIEARAGLACARVDQEDAAGNAVTVAYYKRHPGATDQRRLALWTLDGQGATPSLNPAAGATRHMDDSWVLLPEGSTGDGIIRNFALGGRRVTVWLFADAACTRAFRLDGHSRFRVPVAGVPPTWSLLDTLPWPEVNAPSLAALRRLALEPGAAGTLRATWHYDAGSLELNQLSLCGSRRTCGEGDVGRLGDTRLRPRALAGTVSVSNAATTPLRADDAKTLVRYGRTRQGLGMQTNYSSCPGTPAGQPCRD